MALRWTLVALAVLSLILIPFVIWEEAITELSRSFLSSSRNRWMVAAAAAALLASDVLLPVPSSFVSAFAMGGLGPVWGAGSVWVGMSAGAFIGYCLGRSGGHRAVERIVGRTELRRAERLFQRFGKGVLVVCRGVPVLAEASVLLAGAARMPLFTFCWVTGLSHIGLALSYALLTSVAPEGAPAILIPFALGILVPGAAILLTRFGERANRPG